MSTLQNPVDQAHANGLRTTACHTAMRPLKLRAGPRHRATGSFEAWPKTLIHVSQSPATTSARCTATTICRPKFDDVRAGANMPEMAERKLVLAERLDRICERLEAQAAPEQSRNGQRAKARSSAIQCGARVMHCSCTQTHSSRPGPRDAGRAPT